MNLRNRNIESELEFKSSRSGGKGGQNVNKVETKIELNLNIPESKILTDDEKNRILLKLKNRIDKSGILIITSQTERSQLLNKNKSVKKFFDLTDKALKEDKIRKKSNISKTEKQKRLYEKKLVSVKKILRKIDTKNLDD